MGHASATTTLNTYAHLFDTREHDRMAAMLEEGFGKVLETSYDNPRRSEASAEMPGSAPRQAIAERGN